MSEMIERVAKAIYDAFATVGDYENPTKEDIKNAARAAIEAMREPTEAMDAAAYAADGTNMPLAITYKEAWQAMIDAALKG
ncbi:hypothetical protein [Tardiphaga sp. 709]|uniref:hypothetical protein n=1 Tax=Tardiphaga sp. 709 TaxID=3076039 RepID=UPI0028F09748|nr:hypothetical protein [Tardiphaga sp. 709]WNV09937.1 hypothetical protein RSO67_01710 [Tardiphaga sp. 709]